MSLAISGTNTRENRLVLDKLIHKLLAVSRKCKNGRFWHTAGEKKKEVNVSKPQNNMLTYVMQF